MDKIENVQFSETKSDVVKTKRNTNLLIKLLRELPILDKKPGNSLRQMLKEQISLLDEKHGRTFDPLLKKGFIAFIKEINDFKTSKLSKVEFNMKRKNITLNEDNRFIEAEKIMTSLLRKIASRKIKQKSEHRDKQIEYG